MAAICWKLYKLTLYRTTKQSCFVFPVAVWKADLSGCPLRARWLSGRYCRILCMASANGVRWFLRSWMPPTRWRILPNRSSCAAHRGKLFYIIMFQINANLLIHQRILKKMCDGFHKNIEQNKLFSNTDNKNFPQHQIRILEWFLKDHETLRTGVMMLKNSPEPSQE